MKRKSNYSNTLAAEKPNPKAFDSAIKYLEDLLSGKESVHKPETRTIVSPEFYDKLRKLKIPT
jgi:hypothetical protein